MISSICLLSIYKDIPQWVPPLQMDERIRLNPKKFPFYKHSHASFFIAYERSSPVDKRSSPVDKSNRPIGRLAVLDNRHYNEYNKESTAFFYLFECENNAEAANGLFTAAFDWARSRGLTKILGPKGFTPLDGFGLLVKGFEHRPAFGLPYNPAYYVNLIEAQGFVNCRRDRFWLPWHKYSISQNVFTNLRNGSPNAAACGSHAPIPALNCAHSFHTSKNSTIHPSKAPQATHH